MKTVLLIDDDPFYRESLRLILEDQGLEVIDAECPDQAFAMLDGAPHPDLIVCDLHMPFTVGDQRDSFKDSFEVGVKTAQELAWVYPEAQVVALTAMDKSELVDVKRSLCPIPAHSKPSKIADTMDLIGTYLMSGSYGGIN